MGAYMNNFGKTCFNWGNCKMRPNKCLSVKAIYLALVEFI